MSAMLLGWCSHINTCLLFGLRVWELDVDVIFGLRVFGVGVRVFG